jgi:N-acetylmuramoyl-L-alanine amidase
LKHTLKWIKSEEIYSQNLLIQHNLAIKTGAVSSESNFLNYNPLIGSNILIRQRDQALQHFYKPFLSGNLYRRPSGPGAGLLTLLILIILALPCDVQAQNSLDRISVATRSDGLGYVLRMHFVSAPDSFVVLQPHAEMIQLAVYKNGIQHNQVQFPDAGEVITRYELIPIPGGIALNLHLAPERYYLANAYPDANRRHLLVGLTRSTRGDIDRISDGLSVIDWQRFGVQDSQLRSSSTPQNTMDESGVAPTTVSQAQNDDRNGNTGTEVDTEPILSAVSNQNNSNGRRLRTVVIDAGHGGHDPGAVGQRGTREKDVALAVAKKLGDYINEYLPEVNVVFTRTTDVFLDLHERGSIANRAQGDLFVSVHANASTSRQAYGAEIFFLGVARSQSALEVMKRENSVILLEDPTTRTRELSEEELILYELTNVGYMATSQRIAEKMDHQFSQRAGRRSRGVKQGGFIVLFQASMPAVLVEIGFISNPQEEQYMRSERGQAILASAMFRAIRDYKVSLESADGLQAGE